MKEVHEAALLIPPMKDDEYKALVEDIRENGLIHPIELIDGKIIDGQHRERACLEAHINPRYVEIEVESPIAYVVSANINRRHLSISQKAILAIPIEEMFAKEASERLSQRGKLLRKEGAKKGKPKSFVSLGEPTRTTQEKIDARSITKAAKILGIGPATVQRAKKVYHDTPDLARLVESGEITVTAAFDQAMLREGRGRLAPKKPSTKGTGGPQERYSVRLTRLNNMVKALVRDIKGLNPEDMWRERYVSKLDQVNDNLRQLRGLAARAVVPDDSVSGSPTRAAERPDPPGGPGGTKPGHKRAGRS